MILENVAIEYISISLNQILKAASPALVMILSYYLEGKTYSKTIISTIIITIIGAILTVYHNPDYQTFGFIATVLSTIFGAVQVVISAMLLQKSLFSPVEITLFISAPSLLTVLPIFITFEAKDFFNYTNFTQNGILGLLILMSFLGFAYTLAQFFVINYTSSVYMAVIGNIKVVLLVILSAIIFQSQFTTINIIGVIIAIIGFCIYNFLKAESRQYDTNNYAYTHKMLEELTSIVENK